MNSDRATATKPKSDPSGRVEPASPSASVAEVSSWLCGLLQTCDSFYPTGSYAHSFGLEALVQAGVVRDRDTLRTFLLGCAVPALRHTELPLAAHMWRALANADWEHIGELCVRASAMKTPLEIRAASENIGRQRADLAASLQASALAAEFNQRARANGWPTPVPIAAALEAHVMGAPLGAMLAGIYSTTLASLVSAAMKILRLGQNSAQTLLAEARAIAPDTLAAAITTPLDEIGWSNPWLDIASARHETADARMFIS